MSLTLAEIATHITSSIEVFEKYELDYYEKGNQLLEYACKEKGIDFQQINMELDLMEKQSQNKNNFPDLYDFGIEQLVDFINLKFHSREEENLTLVYSGIRNLLNNKSIESSLSGLLEELGKKFRQLKDELIHHCNHEDKNLFPFIRILTGLQKNKVNLSHHQLSLIKSPVRMLEIEHQQAAMAFYEIKKLVNNYSVPENAPHGYRKLMDDLKALEKDLHMHLHIENNVLFPKLIALEDELNKKLK